MNIRTEPKPPCPLCGSWMVLCRPLPHQSYTPFWGCSEFPGCRGKRDIDSDGLPIIDEISEVENGQ